MPGVVAVKTMALAGVSPWQNLLKRRASPWAPAGCSDQGADRGSGGQQDDAA
jgi:hypothetical protein